MTRSETRSFGPVQRSNLDCAGPAANSFGLKSVLTPTRDQRGEVTHSQANGIDCGASRFARGLRRGVLLALWRGRRRPWRGSAGRQERDPIQREAGRSPLLARRLAEVRRTRARFVPVGDGSGADPDPGFTGFSLREREWQTTRRGPRSKDVIWLLLDLNGKRTVAVRRCEDDRRWHSRTLPPWPCRPSSLKRLQAATTSSTRRQGLVDEIASAGSPRCPTARGSCLPPESPPSGSCRTPPRGGRG